MKIQVRCPVCGTQTIFDVSNKFRPFCSERCHVLDLGAWADEKYAIASDESETASVNENHDSSDSEEEQSFNPPPKHQLN